MRNNKILTLTILLTVLAVLLAGCETVPESIPEDLAPMEYFQAAQTAAGKEHYETALVYYNTFIERYPEDTQRVAEADFEIAFIYYKMKNYEQSKILFEELLAKYEQPGGELLPAWPRILSEKLLITIEEKMSPESEETEDTQAS